MNVSLKLLAAATAVLFRCSNSVIAFQPPVSARTNYMFMSLTSNDNEHNQAPKAHYLPCQQPTKCNSVNMNRRSILSTAGLFFVAGLPQSAAAGIDVSGLRTDGGGSNPALAEQLRAYDGSASARVRQLQEIAPPSTKTASPVAKPGTASEASPPPGIATWLYRASPGFNPRLTRTGVLGNLYRYEDSVVAPNGGRLTISFEFPSDWLQLDKFLGGISYVDQRNGDRLWLLRTRLPEGERLATVPKAFLGTSIFDPQGTIVKSGGIDIDDYKVVSGQVVNNDECDTTAAGASCGATHRRFKIKYSTVTGNGLRVERRALVDAYEVSPQGDVYMLMTSSNAVKFEAKGSPQRETVEAIVNSFRILDL